MSYVSYNSSISYNSSVDLIFPTGDELEHVMGVGRVEGLKQWIQEFRRSNISVDINRITRYATCRRHGNLVEYLVEEQGAKLEQKDKFGRSTIFYAVGTFSVTGAYMVEFIRGKMGTKTFQEEMSHQDVDKKTPWYYAATSASIANVEYCLAAGARPNNHEFTMLEQVPSWREESKHHSQLLLTLYTHL